MLRLQWRALNSENCARARASPPPPTLNMSSPEETLQPAFAAGAAWSSAAGGDADDDGEFEAPTSPVEWTLTREGDVITGCARARGGKGARSGACRLLLNGSDDRLAEAQHPVLEFQFQPEPLMKCAGVGRAGVRREFF